ncbi:competence/damage-inducible protein A [Alicyclobacillus mali]|uniref:Competence/damage-inducible protein A n=1 Tax=Alicyclobacillus mali (ex Roth et al. 2021) TaxID=1123961 RepID=A0ABS0F2X4_9BACL|nr:molybdopterin-binding protein [Alicyclobacillus mali (ex Roth et al. 2021)]MBF8377642.1 competence/damage-inducible protein A [Alicyclobacillus mali (ex Roth et al. 2021)]MCL6487822.1 hypothetical protein [Alicyclobacillus mali (ex Roth et al. 2021)]
MEYNLLRKTEIRVQGIRLMDCHLGDLARTVASCLQLPEERVIVIDVREDEVALDVLLHELPAEAVVGRESQLLSALGAVKGVTLARDARVSADGVLGLIALPQEMRSELLEKSGRMGQDITQRVRQRVILFPTGSEVMKGMIEDTNTPYLADELERMGYRVKRGPILPDDVDAVIGAFNRAIEEGYGLVMTTGGVGAEAKDVNVEAMEAVCDQVAAPYVVRFERPSHRHQKPGIRVGCGRIGITTIVNLPGPHDEVVSCFEAIRTLLDASPPMIAAAMAHTLRDKWGHPDGHLKEHGHDAAPSG